jgi:predicted RNA-binding Zn ribbon-like protein
MFSETNTIGGVLWLNFLNTKRYSDGVVVDLIEDLSLFQEWLADNGFLDGHLAEYLNKEQLQLLRTRLAAVAEEYSKEKGDTDETALDRLNHWLREMPVSLSFHSENGKVTNHFQTVDHHQELQVRIIYSFLQTSEVHGLERVRQCAHDMCILFFLDTSKGGRRRWCNMGTCGNRNKAAKYYHKKKIKNG